MPATPHHPAAFPCCDQRGFLSLCPCFSLFLGHNGPNPPTSSLSTPLLPAAKLGSPVPRASGGYKANGPVLHPSPLAAGLLFIGCWDPPSPWTFPMLVLQPCSPPSALASLTPSFFCPFHSTSLECHSCLGPLVTCCSSFMGSGWCREKLAKALESSGPGAKPGSAV